MNSLPNNPEQPLEKPPQFRTLWSYISEIAQVLIMALVLYFIIDSAVGRVRVQKISMEPTLVEGEILLVNKLAYRFGDVGYGEILTFHYPNDPELDYVKRVIGLPGDSIEIANGQVWVNGRELYEPYISAAPEYEGVWEVPEDNYFVLGDNRNPSADSHIWGYVPHENLIGKAFAVYWPINQIKAIKTPDIFAK